MTLRKSAQVVSWRLSGPRCWTPSYAVRCCGLLCLDISPVQPVCCLDHDTNTPPIRGYRNTRVGGNTIVSSTTYGTTNSRAFSLPTGRRRSGERVKLSISRRTNGNQGVGAEKSGPRLRYQDDSERCVPKKSQQQQQWWVAAETMQAVAVLFTLSAMKPNRHSLKLTGRQRRSEEHRDSSHGARQGRRHRATFDTEGAHEC